LVPRALWPAKPVQAGSPRIVSDYTGIQFASGTSVGVGQVLELYINFGTVGVLAGFFVIGGLMSWIDVEAGRRLAGGDVGGVVPLFLVGIALLQVGGSFVEASASAGASLTVAWLINRFVLTKRGYAPAPTPGPAVS
jgi:hypothetical protein